MENKVGCAFWDPLKRHYQIKKLNNKFSSFSAEQIAILEALNYIENVSGHTHFVIFSDNQSSLKKLSNINTKTKFNYI